jgi:hypothetical protein
VVENVNKRFYGNHILQVTGPNMMKEFVNKKDPIIDLYHSAYPRVIKYNNIVLLQEYDTYRSEQINPHYGDLWTDRKIYSS